MFNTTFLRSKLTTIENAQKAAEAINAYGEKNQISFGFQPSPSIWAKVHELECGFAKVTVECMHPDFEAPAGRILAMNGGIFQS